MDNTEKNLGPGDGGVDGPAKSGHGGDHPAGAGPGAGARIDITRDGMDGKEEDLGPKPSDDSGQGGELHGGTGADKRILLAGEGLEDTAADARKESEAPGVDVHGPSGGDGRVHPRGALPAEEATPTTGASKESHGGVPRSTGVDAFPKEDATPSLQTTTIGVNLHGPNGGDGREHHRGALPAALREEEATPKTGPGVYDSVDVSKESPIVLDDGVGTQDESFTEKPVVGNVQGANNTNVSEHGPGQDALAKTDAALTKSEVNLHVEQIAGAMADSVPGASNMLGATKDTQCVQLTESIGHWEKFLGQQQQLQTSLESRLTSFENRQVHFQEEQKQFAEQQRIDIDQLSKERYKIETLSAELEAKQKIYLERQRLGNQANKRLRNTYYAAQLCGIYGRDEVIGSIGTPNDENLHAALLNKPPKDGNAWSKKQTIYTVIFMVFLPLIFGLEVLFKSKETNNLTQTIVFTCVGAVWGLSTIGGLFGLFNTRSNLPQDYSGHMARLMFLGICLLKVGALWYAMPSTKASIPIAIVLAAIIAIGHIISWIKHCCDASHNNAQIYP